MLPKTSAYLKSYDGQSYDVCMYVSYDVSYDGCILIV